jgi:hypothetical protein
MPASCVARHANPEGEAARWVAPLCPTAKDIPIFDDGFHRMMVLRVVSSEDALFAGDLC